MVTWLIILKPIQCLLRWQYFYHEKNTQKPIIAKLPIFSIFLKWRHRYRKWSIVVPCMTKWPIITSDHNSAKKHMVGVSLIRKNPLIKLQIVLTGPKALFWKSGNLIKLFLNFESWIFLKESWIEMSNYFLKTFIKFKLFENGSKTFSTKFSHFE